MIAGLFELSVYENGVGVDNSIRPKLFEMFFKGDEKSLGTGLGLYVVQKSVQALRGTISMESGPGSFTGDSAQGDHFFSLLCNNHNRMIVNK
jgi:signal transduction histidine kinase